MTSLPADHAIREEALDAQRSFIVEAPAGSGKTELLTRRFLRLLACVKAPEEILAITFTKKAAAEMRSRVVRALALADSNQAPEDSVVRAVWELARAVRLKDDEYGWQLQTHPARLRIMTIDALNSSLARQLPILSGVGAVLSIATDKQALYAEVVLRLVERLGSRDASSNAIARLLKHLDNRYETFESLLSQELARREHWLDIGLLRFDLPTLRAHLEATLQGVVVEELKLVHAAVPRDTHQEIASLASHGASVLNSLGVDSAITCCDELRDLPAPTAESLRQWQGIAKLLLTDDGAWRVRIDKKIGFPPEDKPRKKQLAELLERLAREESLAAALGATRILPDAKYSDAQWETLNDLLSVLQMAIAELEVVMRERSEADFVANAIAARRALGTVTEPTDLALRLDYRLQHILVDEFQDTSRGQVELLSLLTAGWMDGDGRTLFCVGDPMQSIYRFRNADVGLFLNLKRQGLNQLRLQPLRLTVNFRSAKPVIEWINHTFARVLPTRDDPERGAVAFASSSVHAKAANDGGVHVHTVHFDKQSSEKEGARAQEANRIGALIESKLQQPELKIAVLASNRLHLRLIIRELQARAIAFQAVDIDPLLNRPAIQDLIALTRALVHLADRTAWLAVLRAPWCGLSLEDLYALCGSNANQTVWQALNDAVQLALLSKDGQERVARIFPFLKVATELRGRILLRDCVERAWHSIGGPATLTNSTALQDCLAYFDRLDVIERHGDIQDIAQLESQLDDLYAAAESRVDTRVELMTIHRAKGLEFDVVILPGLDSSNRHDNPPLLRAQELPQIGESALLLAPIAPRGGETDSIYAWLEALEKERAQLERARLLYVGATRAKSELHLFGVVERTADEIKEPRANTFLRMLWPVVEREVVENIDGVLAGGDHANGIKDKVVSASIETLRLPSAWQLPVAKQSVGGTLLRDIAGDDLLQPEFQWAGETSRHIGTLVHREIERLAGTQSIRPSDAAYYLKELAELGVPPHLREAAAVRVTEALTQMMNDERGRWLLSSDLHRDAMSEFALSGVIGSEIVNGVIDRTFVAADGTRWIVDFKTSSHEGGGLEEFLESEVDRYRLQMQRYATLMRGFKPNEIVKAALYFPLLKAWCEVPV